MSKPIKFLIEFYHTGGGSCFLSLLLGMGVHLTYSPFTLKYVVITALVAGVLNGIIYGVDAILPEKKKT
jgi:hypothetical protein